MILDRELQRQILEIASTVYPRSVGNELDELYEPLEDQKLAANLKYLE